MKTFKNLCQRLFGGTKSQSPTKRSQRVRLTLENLESRCLPTAGPTATLGPDGTLRIFGVPGVVDDTIELGVSGVNFTLNATPITNVNRFKVKHIHINGFMGDDTIRVDEAIRLNTTLIGGPGNDTIHGGDGMDRIWGDDEGQSIDSGGIDTLNDKLYGRSGRDIIHGGPGLDRLFGGMGRDDLYGDDGDDFLDGGGVTAGNLLHGGGGINFDARQWAVMPKYGDARATEPNDVHQNQAGTCAILASLAAVTKHGGVDLDNWIRYAEEGQYRVRLFDRDTLQPKWVTVEFDGFTNSTDPITSASQWGSANEDIERETTDFWTVLFQRAYLQECGFDWRNVAATSSFPGDYRSATLRMLTGIPTNNEIVIFGNRVWEDVLNQRAKPIVVGSDPYLVDEDVATKHAYALQNAFVDGTGQRQVDLYNPHGEFLRMTWEACVDSFNVVSIGEFPQVADPGPEPVVDDREDVPGLIGAGYGSVSAMDAEGNYAVAWWRPVGDAQYHQQLFVQAFDNTGMARADAKPLGKSANAQARITMNSQGNFVVTWVEALKSAKGQWLPQAIKAQRFDVSGKKQGAAIIVSRDVPVELPGAGWKTTKNDTRWLTDPDVAIDGFGNFTVVWTGSRSYVRPNVNKNYAPDGWWNMDIYASQYNARGGFVRKFKVNTDKYRSDLLDGADFQMRAKIAMNAAGSFVVVWESKIQGRRLNSIEEELTNEIVARRFGPLGANPEAPQLITQVLSAAERQNHQQYSPLVALAPDRTFMVSWNSIKYFDGNQQECMVYAAIVNSTASAGALVDRMSFINHQVGYSVPAPTGAALAADTEGNFVRVLGYVTADAPVRLWDKSGKRLADIHPFTESMTPTTLHESVAIGGNGAVLFTGLNNGNVKTVRF